MSQQFDQYAEISYREGTDRPIDPGEQRALWKWEAAIGYRMFAALRWGQLGDGHITFRDPERRDHFWMLSYGVPFRAATIHDLILIAPDGTVAEGPAHATANTAGYNIHKPLLEVRQDINSGAHTHTAFGTPWSANVEPFRAISQESCSFVFNQAIYDGEDLEVDSTDGGYRIADAMGSNTLVILRNHGLLTGGQSPAESVGWFVLAERVAEVHVKAPNGKAISDEMAKHIARSFEDPAMGWRTWQWLARDLVPDPSVVV